MAEYRKSSMDILNDLTKMFKETQFEEWAQIQSADEYAQQHPESNATQAFCDRFGISAENLHLIVDFLQSEPGTPEATEKLNTLLQKVEEHAPAGPVSRAQFAEWKELTQDAAQSMQDLNGSWASFNDAKKEFEKLLEERKEAEQQAAKRVEHLEAIGRPRLETIRQNIEEAARDILTLEEKLTSPSLQLTQEEQDELKNSLEAAKARVAAEKERYDILNAALEEAPKDLQAAVDARELAEAQLQQAEDTLKRQTFADNATALISMLPERMSDAIKRAPVLEATTFNIKLMSQDVKELATKYQEKSQEYGRGKFLFTDITKAQELQASDNKLKRWFGDIVIDREVNRVQKHFGKELRRDVEELQKAFDKEMGRTHAIFNLGVKCRQLRDNVVMNVATFVAKMELSEVNRYEKKIMLAKEHAEAQVMREMKRDSRYAEMEPDSIKQTDDYKKRLKEVVDARVKTYEGHKQKALDNFKSSYTHVHNIAKSREEHYKDLAQRAAKLEATRVDLQKSHDLNPAFSLDKQMTGFSHDLNQLMRHHNAQVAAFAFIENKDVQQVMDEVERDR